MKKNRINIWSVMKKVVPLHPQIRVIPICRNSSLAQLVRASDC